MNCEESVIFALWTNFSKNGSQENFQNQLFLIGEGCYSIEFRTGTQESTILQKVLEMLIKLSIQYEFCQNEPERRSPKII
jgi:hypothetical protein